MPDEGQDSKTRALEFWCPDDLKQDIVRQPPLYSEALEAVPPCAASFPYGSSLEDPTMQSEVPCLPPSSDLGQAGRAWNY